MLGRRSPWLTTLIWAKAAIYSTPATGHPTIRRPAERPSRVVAQQPGTSSDEES